MQTLKIWFTDFWPEWKDEDFITPILKKNFEIVLDKNKPDILFHSIFGRTSPSFKCKKILFIAENIRNNYYNNDIRNNINIALNGASATIGFDPTSDTNYRLPLWQVYILLKPELKDRLYQRKNWSEEQFKRWCSFTVSNSSNSLRNLSYQQLNRYKHVDSYGRYMNTNGALQEASKGRYWRDAKDEYFLKFPHKFMIAYENTPAKFYCTEKLMDAFLVGSMPIYWGDPRVGEDWNQEAFIDVTRGDFDKIFRVDKDWELFKSIYQQPVFTEEQKIQLEFNLNNFPVWLLNKIK